jgi:hypothetical protein
MSGKHKILRVKQISFTKLKWLERKQMELSIGCLYVNSMILIFMKNNYIKI